MTGKELFIFLLILALGLTIRAIPALNMTFMEPDNLIYYQTANLTIQNHGIIPQPDPYSGFPTHSFYTEQPMLIYFIVIPYYFLNLFTQVNEVEVMYLIQIIFSTIGMVVVYKLAKFISDNKPTAYFATFLYATMPAAIFKNSLPEWQGILLYPF